jgi:DNA-binding CsgD family transcriptional regulator
MKSHPHEVLTDSGELRDSGFPIFTAMPWGTHLCVFYETPDDLVDTHTAYFEAGLKAHEFCFWAVSAPLDVKSATAALQHSIPDMDKYLETGQIELIPAKEWYLPATTFELERVIHGWEEKLLAGLARGFVGMRACGDSFWSATNHWKEFYDYERDLNRSIDGKKMIILCMYALSKSRVGDLFDVARVHHCSLARRNGEWEFLESPELKHAKREIKKLNGALDILSSKAFPGHENLTPRERAVLAQIVRGLSSKEVARILAITPRTVEFHRANLLRKTNAKSTVDLVRIVLGEQA